MAKIKTRTLTKEYAENYACLADAQRRGTGEHQREGGGLSDLIEVGQSILLTGDVLTLLPMLPDQSVQCVVTSPPYYGLRDYGVAGQIGLEQTPQAYVDALVAVFREVWRVLRDDGVVWLNLGDSYNAHPGQRKITDSVGAKQETNAGSNSAPSRHVPGLAAKQLIGIPWRVAFALQADGWYLRQDIIWAKPNPMPESVRDRCTKAHEYIFMLTKNARYFYDATAIDEPISESYAKDNRPDGVLRQRLYDGSKYVIAGMVAKLDGVVEDFKPRRTTRNKRSVWWVSPKPFKGAHFATFPPDLIEPCILAGSRPGDLVLDPFGGSGTTGMVSNRHGRRSILIDLNPEYVKIAVARLEKDLIDHPFDLGGGRIFRKKDQEDARKEHSRETLEEDLVSAGNESYHEGE